MLSASSSTSLTTSDWETSLAVFWLPFPSGNTALMALTTASKSSFSRGGCEDHRFTLLVESQFLQQWVVHDEIRQLDTQSWQLALCMFKANQKLLVGLIFLHLQILKNSFMASCNRSMVWGPYFSTSTPQIWSSPPSLQIFSTGKLSSSDSASPPM